MVAVLLERICTNEASKRSEKSDNISVPTIRGKPSPCRHLQDCIQAGIKAEVWGYTEV
jgi:hypothetical protein